MQKAIAKGKCYSFLLLERDRVMVVQNNEKSMPETMKNRLGQAITDAIAMHIDETIGEQYFSRNRKLTKEIIIKCLIAMQGGSINKELYDMGIDATASAFVQRRKQISSIDMENVFEIFNSYCQDKETYKGYRILAVDGTTINMSRNPKAPSFVKNDGKGYNQFHVTPLYDVLNKTYQHCVIQPQPQQDEIGALRFMLTWFYSGKEFKKILIVADRGFESYNMVSHFLNERIDFLIRVKQDRSAMREIRKLPMMELDTKINFFVTTTQTKTDKENGYVFIQTQKNKNRIYSSKTKNSRWDFPSPYPLSFRVVRFMLDTGEYETLITSLPSIFTITDLKELYHARWGIETSFRELKYGIGLTNLHGKCDEFVKQEIFESMIISNFCNRIAREVIIEQNKKNSYIYKVNQTMAIHLCRKFYREENMSGKKLMQDIKKYTEPVRPDRKDERNIKAKSFVGFTYRVSA